MAREEVAAGEGALRTWTMFAGGIDQEVVYQAAVGAHRLGAHPRRAGHHVAALQVRHIALQRAARTPALTKSRYISSTPMRQ